MGIETALGDKFGEGVLVTTLEKAVNWARKSSLWPCSFGLACCALEMIDAVLSPYDLARFGMEVFRPSPRHADLMIVAGTVTKKMLPAVVRIYEQMAEPKWVIAMGACASTGGIFRTYAVVQGIDQYIPVDMYIPGCPPRPEALIDGMLKLHERIMREKPLHSRKAVLPPDQGAAQGGTKDGFQDSVSEAREADDDKGA